MNDADDVEAELASRSLAEVTSPPRLAFGSNTRRAGLEDRCTGVPARHRPLTMVSTKTRPPASRAPEDGTTAPELARLGHDPACHPRASSATRVSLTPASASGASRRGPLRALGRGARRRLQKTRLYQFVPPVTFPSPERSTRQGHPQQPPDPPSHVAHPSGHEPPEAPERRVLRSTRAAHRARRGPIPDRCRSFRAEFMPYSLRGACRSTDTQMATMMTGQGREDVRFLSLSAGLRYWRCR